MSEKEISNRFTCNSTTKAIAKTIRKMDDEEEFFTKDAEGNIIGWKITREQFRRLLLGEEIPENEFEKVIVSLP